MDDQNKQPFEDITAEAEEPKVTVEDVTSEEPRTASATEDIVSKLKELVKDGNVARILVRRGDSTILNIPLNAGLLGTALGVAAAPWALIGATVATLGLDAQIVLVKKDGSTMELLSRTVGKKAADAGVTLLNRFSGKS